MFYMRSIKLALLLITMMFITVPAYAAKIEDEFGPREVEIGKQAVDEIIKQQKLVDKSPDLDKVRAIGAALTAIANKNEIKASYGSSKVTPFEYKFNIVQDDDINAFSVPGGNIFVNTGLLKFIQSDQELAGVLAHEVIHDCHHHMIYLLNKQAAVSNQVAAVMLATILTRTRTSDMNNVMLGMQLYQIATVNGYGMDAERDADKGAAQLMKQAGYNPVGLLTFLERLSWKPELVDLGIYRTHPEFRERIAYTRQVLKDMKIPVNRRETTAAAKAEVKMEKVNGADTPSLYLKDKLLLRVAATDGKSASDRANLIADTINKSLDGGLQLRELNSDQAGGIILGRNTILLTITQADAALNGKSIADLTKAAASVIRGVLFKQSLDVMQ